MSGRRFRKKPVVIEAVQVPDIGAATHNDFFETLRAMGANQNPSGAVLMPMNDHILIQTLEGTMRADVGDWIIRGVKGEFYPCKPDIFEATYEQLAD